MHQQNSASCSNNVLNEVLEKIAVLLPVFKERAKTLDSENRFPTENFELIKSEGLLNLIIPQQFGGMGLNFEEYQICISKLASACASTAACLNMHCIVLGALADIFNGKLTNEQIKFVLPYARYIFDKVVNGKKVFASATSELGIGARYSKAKTTYEIVEDGYVINGTKVFVSMAGYADYYSIIARDRANPDNNSLTFFIVEKNTMGITVEKDWDVVGMRGTQSYKLIFNNVLIPKENTFLGITGFALMKVVQSPHWVTGGYLGVYLGIMEAALSFTINYIKERSDYCNNTGLAFDPIIQVGLAKLNYLYQHSFYSVRYAAKLILKQPTKKETHQALYLAKYTVGENALQLTTSAMKLCGGTTIHKKYELERYMRDSICASLMPLTSSACEVYIGKSLLDLSIENVW